MVAASARKGDRVSVCRERPLRQGLGVNYLSSSKIRLSDVSNDVHMKKYLAT